MRPSDTVEKTTIFFFLLFVRFSCVFKCNQFVKKIFLIKNIIEKKGNEKKKKTVRISVIEIEQKII